MSDFDYHNQLLDFYAKLLTTKQQQIMEYYYRENYSLSEIAEILDVSKTAVADSIKRSVTLLLGYEDKLSLVYKFIARQQIYEKLSENKENLKLIQQLNQIEE